MTPLWTPDLSTNILCEFITGSTRSWRYSNDACECLPSGNRSVHLHSCPLVCQIHVIEKRFAMFLPPDEKELTAKGHAPIDSQCRGVQELLISCCVWSLLPVCRLDICHTWTRLWLSHKNTFWGRRGRERERERERERARERERDKCFI